MALYRQQQQCQDGELDGHESGGCLLGVPQRHAMYTLFPRFTFSSFSPRNVRNLDFDVLDILFTLITTMSRVPRLLRTIHSSAARLNTAVSSSEAGSATSGGGAARSRGVDEPRTGSWANSHGETVPVKFTPKGRPLFGRPPRKTRVSLPSGYPEPPAYPPPAEYFKELDEITAALPAGMSKPKAHPLWAFFHVPPEAEQRLSPTTTLQDMGSLESMDNEVDARDSGEYRASWASRRPWSHLPPAC